MRFDRLFPLVLAAGLGGLAGCTEVRDATAGTADECTRCHGGFAAEGIPAAVAVSGAPPFDLDRNTERSAPGVGAHTQHLANGVACAACHPVPGGSPGAAHLNGVTDVALGGAAAADGATPAWDPATLTCASVYCHGTTLDAGGARTAPPVWTEPLGTPRCTQCHGFPPPAPHPAAALCASCHTATVTSDGTFRDATRHANGELDVGLPHPAGYASRASGVFHGPDAIRFLQSDAGATECAGCHGPGLDGNASVPSCNACHAAAGWAAATSPTWQQNCTFCHGTRTRAFDPATQLALAGPPPAVDEQVAATDRSVGAHQRHLGQSPSSNGVACQSCHAVPPSATPLAALAHVDGSAAVALPGVQQGQPGTYAADAQTCTTWCHAQPGATVPAPTWTSTTPLGCTACHGAPPATGSHPGSPQTTARARAGHIFGCDGCHAAVASPTGLANRALHVNGTVNVDLPPGVGAYDATARTCAALCHTAAGLPAAQPWIP
jgi:predicted CxxxxCH...CXXCH cytochrome family protein